MLFTLTMHCFLPSVAVHHLSERSLLASLVWGLGRAVYAAVAGRVVINIVKICHLTQQQTRALSVLLFFFSMIYNFLSGNKNRKHWSSNMHLEGVGSALGYFEQTELLALFYWVFVSFPPLLQTIQTKMNRLSVLFHLQLVTCLQNSRIAKKYELVVEVSGMIWSYSSKLLLTDANSQTQKNVKKICKRKSKYGKLIFSKKCIDLWDRVWKWSWRSKLNETELNTWIHVFFLHILHWTEYYLVPFERSFNSIFLSFINDVII